MTTQTLQAATHAATESLVSLVRKPCGRRGEFYALLQIKARGVELACSRECRALGFGLLMQPISAALTLDAFARQIESCEGSDAPTKDDRAIRLSHVACLSAALQSHCFDFLDD